MTSSPKPGGGTYTYQNDVLGNRTWRNYGQSGVQRYVWDEVNRLKSLCGTSEGARYEYRADGMRVKKITGLTIEWIDDNSQESMEESSGYYDEHLDTNLPTWRYFYDGQMVMEEDSTYKENSANVVDYTQYGLGARGIDYIRNVHHSSGTTVVFPIYDAHGNMIYTLTRETNDACQLGNKRIYGAWGDLRHDSNPGDGPNTQYCANLGHKFDDESDLTDLTYMRARYYEPWTGRFISQDRSKHGTNWFVYATNNPISGVDYSGNETEDERYFLIGSRLYGLGVFMMLHGTFFFAWGVVTFYAGRKVFLAGAATVDLIKSIAGIAMMVYGTYTLTAATNLFVRGVYVTQAGKFLQALGEDGVELAMLYLAACNGRIPHINDFYTPDPFDYSGL